MDCRLDYAYYNLLEKITNLHSAIPPFQDLADLSLDLHVDFKREIDNLERDIHSRVDESKGFVTQIQRIETLEARMRAGGEKAVSLGGRLEVVKRKISAWERREGEWQARISRRLWVLWAAMGVFAMVMVAAMTVERNRPTRIADKHHNDASLKCVTNRLHREWSNLPCNPPTSRNNESQANWVMAHMELMVKKGRQESICVATSTTATISSPSECNVNHEN